MITSQEIADITYKYHDVVKRDIVRMFPELESGTTTYTLDKAQAEKLAKTYSTDNMYKVMRLVCKRANGGYTDYLIALIKSKVKQLPLF